MSSQQSLPPIFIVGVPRSGTTLFAAMMAAHPRLVGGPETHFFNSLSTVNAHDLCRRADWPEKAVDFLYSIKHVGESIPADYGLTRQELTEAMARRKPSIASILSGMIEVYTDRNGKRRWVEKTPDHLPNVARIREHYPDSPIIRIVRDPRDVAASLLAVNWSWGPSTLATAILLWRDYDDRSARFFEVDPKSHTVRYEDLVRNPELTLREVCRFIGEPFDPAMLDTHTSARLVNAVNEEWKTKVGEKVDVSRAEAWRQKCSIEDLRVITAIAGDRLRAYGYAAHDFEGSRYIEVYPLRSLTNYPELAADLLARRARFWGLPGEKPELSLFLGDPFADRWFGRMQRNLLANPAGDQGLCRLRWSRFIDTVWIACAIVRRRLDRVPIAWYQAPGTPKYPGLCIKALAYVLPRPTHFVPWCADAVDASPNTPSTVPDTPQMRPT